jgi:hypothetical protein
MRLLIRGRDPYWDLDGRTVRRDRRLRRILQVLVAWAIVALLIVVFRPMNVRAAGAEAAPFHSVSSLDAGALSRRNDAHAHQQRHDRHGRRVAPG